jgi:hypothetical protein
VEDARLAKPYSFWVGSEPPPVTYVAGDFRFLGAFAIGNAISLAQLMEVVDHWVYAQTLESV